MLKPVQLFKILSDETRLAIIMLLRESGELCVCEICAATSESQPKISRHMAILRGAELVLDRREGKWVYYRLSPHMPAWAAETITTSWQCLKDGVGLLPTVLDVAENPKNLKIVELEAPQLPRSLDDAQIALAVINTTYASQIGLTPAKDGIFVEDKDSPYVNMIVSREDNKDAENVKKFVQAYQSEEVYQEANKVFNGGAVKGW